MCGIVGYATVTPGCMSDAFLANACQAMRHRGPDGQGVWTDPYCGLGHRRLSIIDLEGGGQPMSDLAGRYWITFNGEIYNYRELRDELVSHGQRFRTNSDTEVILGAYRQWGVEAPTRLRGIFALAIWDCDERTLFLARDHLGVKPLLYFCRRDLMVFASELKGLLASGVVAPQVDTSALSDFLALGYTMGAKTMIRGVNRLEPGTTLLWRDGHARVRSFWELAAAVREPELSFRSLDDCVQQYSHHLENAVTTQMVSDVPIGAFLSGGLDSSTVAYYMSQKAEAQVRTFSMGFSQSSYNELPFAEVAAAALGTAHHSETVSDDLAEALPALVHAFDEPLGDTSIVPTYYVSRLARREVKVVLSGDGADETLAGYDTYAADAWQRVYRHIPGFVHSTLVKPLSRLIPDSARKVSLNYKAKQFIEHARGDWRHAHYGWRLLFSDDERDALLGGAGREHDPFGEYRTYFDAVAGASWLNQCLYVDLKTWLANDILPKVDRASMSVGLEARVPFLDHRLVEFAIRLPASMKMRGLRRKVVLRRAMRRRLPDVVIKRRKRGFNAPVSSWLRGSLRPLCDDVLSVPSSLVDVRHPTIQQTWMNHRDGRADHGFRLWSLLTLLVWERLLSKKSPGVEPTLPSIHVRPATI